MKHIVYTRADGGAAFGTFGVTLCTPAPGARIVSEATLDGEQIDGLPMRADQLNDLYPSAVIVSYAETEDEFLARIADKDVPTGVSFILVDDADLPDHASFDRWKIVDGKVRAA